MTCPSSRPHGASQRKQTLLAVALVSSAVTTVSAQSAPYYGCVTEASTDRIANFFAFSSQSSQMSGSACVARCVSRSAPFALIGPAYNGDQFSCFCATSSTTVSFIRRNPGSASGSTCSLKCSNGDECGRANDPVGALLGRQGAWSVYTVESAPSSSQQQPSASPSPSNIVPISSSSSPAPTSSPPTSSPPASTDPASATSTDSASTAALVSERASATSSQSSTNATASASGSTSSTTSTSAALGSPPPLPGSGGTSPGGLANNTSPNAIPNSGTTSDDNNPGAASPPSNPPESRTGGLSTTATIALSLVSVILVAAGALIGLLASRRHRRASAANPRAPSPALSDRSHASSSSFHNRRRPGNEAFASHPHGLFAWLASPFRKPSPSLSSTSSIYPISHKPSHDKLGNDPHEPPTQDLGKASPARLRMLMIAPTDSAAGGLTLPAPAAAPPRGRTGSGGYPPSLVSAASTPSNSGHDAAPVATTVPPRPGAPAPPRKDTDTSTSTSTNPTTTTSDDEASRQQRRRRAPSSIYMEAVAYNVSSPVRTRAPSLRVAGGAAESETGSGTPTPPPPPMPDTKPLAFSFAPRGAPTGSTSSGSSAGGASETSLSSGAASGETTPHHGRSKYAALVAARLDGRPSAAAAPRSTATSPSLVAGTFVDHGSSVFGTPSSGGVVSVRSAAVGTFVDHGVLYDDDGSDDEEREIAAAVRGRAETVASRRSSLMRPRLPMMGYGGAVARNPFDEAETVGVPPPTPATPQTAQREEEEEEARGSGFFERRQGMFDEESLGNSFASPGTSLGLTGGEMGGSLSPHW
ncbi:hypothetical protein HDU96_002375 [Phlyctochytrium bullatum]|nr:hypothetical protein HDU96_002375 [Phlyctochytrium bullatum]